jgi:TonB-linked SusC/RagA family outer membrane protein
MKKNERLLFLRKRSIFKMLLLMKFTIAFILLTSLQLSAKTTYSQDRITINLQSTELKSALRQIEKKSIFRFLYNDEVISSNQKVSINAVNSKVTEVLDNILTSTTLTYHILDNNLVVITKKNLITEDVRVTGKVTGPTVEGLPGVTVKIRGSSVGTSTDASGNYSISVPDGSTLVFTSIGYEDLEVAVNSRTVINVSLKISAKSIDAVVFVGYGTQRKIDVTGAVTQIKGEEISKQASINPISALQGKVAGVQITNSGSPGASPQIRIRGLGTVYGNANPLYVVDGVWFDDISFLNNNDIENISVLKDASSESIYGIRAANGVVLINTKKGRAGRTTVNYNGYVGLQHITNEVKMANGNEYAAAINELAVINGSPAFLTPGTYGGGTDWNHQILRNAMVTNHQISVSGGSDKSNYNFSFGYLNQDGIVEKNNFTRYTIKLQNDFQITKGLKMGYIVTSAAIKSKDIDGGIFHQLYGAAPIVPVFYADGTYGDPSDFKLGDGNNYNPQVTMDFYKQNSANYRLTGSAYLDYKFAGNFTFHSSIGGEFAQNEVVGYTPVYTATLKQRNANSSLIMSRAEQRNWILENTLTYDKKIHDHTFKVLLGQSAQRIKSYGFTGSAKDVPYTREGDLFLSLGTAGTRNITDQGDLATVASYFGRVNYSFKNRYLLTASMRADGSSKFFGSDRWGYLPSVGVGWVISSENFMQSQTLFNNLKLRASWGKIGNASVPSNLSILTITQAPYLISYQGNVINTGASITSIVPPTTYWEKGVGTDLGLEASFIHSRLSIDIDLYNKKTERAIFDVPIPSSLGTSSGTIIANQADIQNRGFEFAANWRGDVNDNLKFTIGGNIAYNENKVLAVTSGSNAIYGGGGAATGGALATRTIVGSPIGGFYGYQAIGVFQNATEVASSAQKDAKPGDLIYKDVNNDKVIDGKDRMPIGNPNPKISYGINTTWSYKQFDLSVDFQGVAGVDIYNANLGIRYGNENFTKDYYDNRWHGEGTSNIYPSANIGGGKNYLPNSFFVSSGSYFRVRNIQLGYTLGSTKTTTWKIQKLRIFIDAQNAFNFFKYKGFSPEIGQLANAGPTSAGIDANVYPLAATYRLGVNVTF